jgi:AAA+ ATPase superfamily predicted ATPase
MWMTKFIGREEELETLRGLLRKTSASLIVIKGRRRIGKSRLLEEFARYIDNALIFSGLAPTENTTDQSQREEFSSQFIKQLNISPTNNSNWHDLFWDVAQYTKQGRVLVVFDEITWMGSEDPDFLSKLKNAWDLYFKKNDHFILAICGSSSAWIDENILSSTGFFGRVSLTLTLRELPLYDCAKFWNEESERTSSHEKLKVLAVTGGIPRYLEHIDPVLSAEDNLCKMCFDENGILFDEFEKIFSDLFAPKNIFYKDIVGCLLEGISDQKTISSRMNLKLSGDISEYLDNLIKSGFVSRDYTWVLKSAKTSTLSHYRLKDNYSRFYLKYIFPNRVNIEAGNMKNISLASLQGWYSIMGLQVENLILSNRHLVKDALKINPNDIVYDNPFFQRKTARQSGCQIDYLIQTKYNTLYICEIKFSNDKIGTQVIEEMKEKIERLNMPRHFSYRTVLIHVNGVTDALQDTQYFSHIIDLGTFLKEK